MLIIIHVFINNIIINKSLEHLDIVVIFLVFLLNLFNILLLLNILSLNTLFLIMYDEA